MANIGYIQMVRHCNQNCGFCSNPETPWFHGEAEVRAIIDDFARRDYFGVIFTGGEPTLTPILAASVAYARERGLHTRMISNGQKLADRTYLRTLERAGLDHVHISVHSHNRTLEDFLTGTPGSLAWAEEALDHLADSAIRVDVNIVINRYNADQLHETIAWFETRFPHVRHFIFNNLDPSIGRAHTNQYFTPTLRAMELSLQLAMQQLSAAGRTFRVEKVPLCYMAGFEHCSTETRKIIKSEERIVHFLDEKGTVRQQLWGHRQAKVCEVCTLRAICAGLFDRGEAYDEAELTPVFVDPRAVVRRVAADERSDPAWRRSHLRGAAGFVAAPAQSRAPAAMPPPDGSRLVTPQHNAKRRRDPWQDWHPVDAAPAAATSAARSDSNDRPSPPPSAAITGEGAL